jgi:hypothetical protein
MESLGKKKRVHNNTQENYKTAKIYKLCCDDCEDIYIGSTNYPYLSMRFWRHKRDALDEDLDRFGDIFKTDNARCELVENYPCRNKEELRHRERFWIETLKLTEKVVNKRKPIEYPVEKIESSRARQKDWYWNKGGRESRLKKYNDNKEKANNKD